MRKWFQGLICLCVLLSSSLLLSPASLAAVPDDGVKVQINNELVQFPDTYPFIDTNRHLLVPFRIVSEKLGFQVSWDIQNSQVHMTLVKDKISIELTTGNSTAIINGQSTILSSQAVFTEGRVFVPLRFITDTIGVEIQWDAEDGIAILDADGSSHAPVWHAPAAADSSNSSKVQTNSAAVVNASAAKNTSAENSAASLIHTAFGYLGVPYVWGGTSPSGFDCSGFVQFVFKRYGIDLPRTSREMYSSVGTPVKTPEPGDLVFFASNGSTISHVGIYIGDNQYISATSGATQAISVTSMSSNWSSKYYAGAKRVL